MMFSIMVGGDTGQTVVPEIFHSEHQQEIQICGEIPVYGALVVRTTGHNFLIGLVNGDPAKVRHMMNAPLHLLMTRTWPPVGRHATPVLIRAQILVETPAKILAQTRVQTPVKTLAQTPVKIPVWIPARTPVGAPALPPARIPVKIHVIPV
jgi:hypothetical protein